jgi:phytoene/squalene synthetase
VIPDDYCAERVRAAGGDPELIVRFAPADRRALHCALAALRAELEHLVEQHHEPAVATAKVAWWRSELAGFAAGDARHPATRALLAADLDRAGMSAAMLAFSDALVAELGGRCTLPSTDWQAMLAARGSWSRALSAVDRASPDAGVLAALGAALAELEVLATLGRRLAASRPALDAGWGLGQAAFDSRDPAALDLVSTRAQVAGTTLVARRDAAAASPALAIACALGLRRAKLLAADPTRAWRPQERSSLGALFTAWRAAL